jgi:alpha/beta superfamily hydrolase
LQPDQNYNLGITICFYQKKPAHSGRFFNFIEIFFMKYWLSFSLIVAFSSGVTAQNTHQNVSIKTAQVTLAATLCTPEKAAQTAFLIIPGSGPTDRNCNGPMIKTDAYLQLADSLAAHGFASLRYDKRGIAESAADFNEADMRFEDGVADARACLQWLKDQGYQKIIVAGHSEGSLIGMLAAKELADGFISISGIAMRANEIIKEQLSAQLSGSMLTQINGQLDSLASGMEVHNNNPMLQSLFRPSVQPYLISWMAYDPCVEISKIAMPVLVINGTLDVQVGVENAEKLAGCAAQKTEARVLVNMTHTLKRVNDPADQMKSYSDPKIPLDTDLVKEMVAFANQF